MDIATSVNPESETALSSLEKAEVCMETPSTESSFPPEPMTSSRSLSLGPVFSLSLSNSRLNSLSGRSDLNTFNTLPMDDFMLGPLPNDDVLSSGISPSISEFQLLQQCTSTDGPTNSSMARFTSLPFEGVPMDIEDSANNFLNVCFNPSYMDSKENPSRMENEALSFADPLQLSGNADNKQCGLLPSGSIRNMPIQMSPSCVTTMTDLSRECPLPNTTHSFSMFDDQYCGTSGETLADSNGLSGSTSVFSDDNNLEDSYCQKKKQTRSKKKWRCSNCHYINNLSNTPSVESVVESKACLNCGRGSPLRTSSSSSIDYDSTIQSPQNPSTSDPSSIRPTDLADPADPVNTSVAIRLIGKDVEVGGGYTMKDFPFAYIPPNPFGDNSVAALKLLMLRSRKNEPRICAHCGMTSTPKWRRSPPPMRFLLCNACGLQYNKSADKHNAHTISPLEECQGEYCVRARASGNYIKRRLFNRHILVYDYATTVIDFDGKTSMKMNLLRSKTTGLLFVQDHIRCMTTPIALLGIENHSIYCSVLYEDKVKDILLSHTQAIRDTVFWDDKWIVNPFQGENRSEYPSIENVHSFIGKTYDQAQKKCNLLNKVSLYPRKSGEIVFQVENGQSFSLMQILQVQYRYILNCITQQFGEEVTTYKMTIPVHFSDQEVGYITKTLQELRMVGMCVREPCILTYYYMNTLLSKPKRPCYCLVIDWRNQRCVFTVVRIEETQVIPIKYWRVDYIGYDALAEMVREIIVSKYTNPAIVHHLSRSTVKKLLLKEAEPIIDEFLQNETSSTETMKEFMLEMNGSFHPATILMEDIRKAVNRLQRKVIEGVSFTLDSCGLTPDDITMVIRNGRLCSLPSIKRELSRSFPLDRIYLNQDANVKLKGLVLALRNADFIETKNTNQLGIDICVRWNNRDYELFSKDRIVPVSRSVSFSVTVKEDTQPIQCSLLIDGEVLNNPITINIPKNRQDTLDAILYITTTIRFDRKGEFSVLHLQTNRLLCEQSFTVSIVH